MDDRLRRERHEDKRTHRGQGLEVGGRHRVRPYDVTLQVVRGRAGQRQVRPGLQRALRHPSARRNDSLPTRSQVGGFFVSKLKCLYKFCSLIFTSFYDFNFYNLISSN